MLWFFFCVCMLFIIWLLVPFWPLIYYSPKNHQIEKSAGRLSEWSESEMLSFPHSHRDLGVWHVLYIFPVPTSLNKYNLMYSSQEMKFHATDFFLPPWVCSAPLLTPTLPSSQSPHPQSKLVPCDFLLWFWMVTHKSHNLHFDWVFMLTVNVRF